jgi:hypothetical protein
MAGWQAVAAPCALCSISYVPSPPGLSLHNSHWTLTPQDPFQMYCPKGPIPILQAPTYFHMLPLCSLGLAYPLLSCYTGFLTCSSRIT